MTSSLLFKTVARTALLVAAASALLTTAAHARSLQQIKSAGEIAIVTTSSSPPHGFLDPKTNALSGIMFDVGNAIAKRIGVTAKFTEVPFSGLIPTLTSGRADAMAAPLFITPDRAKVVDFSIPVYGWGEGIVVNTKDHAHYPDFDALKGKKIGTLTDSVQYKMAQALTGTTVTAYPDYISLIADVRAGRIDLGIVDPPSVAYQIQSHNISGVALDSSYHPTKDWQVALAVPKGDADLRKAIDDALQAMKADGTLKAILTKWNVPNLMVP